VFRKNHGTLLGWLVVSGCWSSPPAPAAPIANSRPAVPAAPQLKEVAAAEFGIWDLDGQFHPTFEVPLHAGSVFGWRVSLPCTTPFVPIQEELRLPAPGDWGSDPDMTISRDLRSVIIRNRAECHDGWIEKQWSVSAGDPAGVWAVRITAEGYATRTFRATFTPDLPLPGP
jgi:hypothetical protein